jgi:hypothetical protein
VTGALPGTIDSVGNTVNGALDGVTNSGVLDGNLLNVNVNVNLDADMAAPIAGAVAANANVAAPIDASAGANIASIDSHATAVSEQTAIINQHLDGADAEATANQDANIQQ